MQQVQDLIANEIDEEDEMEAHTHKFRLWPKLWLEYMQNHSFTFSWHSFQLNECQIGNIPEKPGIYTLIIQPGIALHPFCSYLAYVGKTERTLKERFREYLKEKNTTTGRPKIVRWLNKYEGHTFFCCTAIEDTDLIEKIEDALITAWVPPCNDKYPARIRRVINALR